MDDKVKLVVAVASGAAAGSVVTYFAVRTKLRREYAHYAMEEIESVKDTYRLLRKEPPYDDPRTAAEAYLERIDELQYESANLHKPGEEPEPEEEVREDDEPVDLKAIADDLILSGHSYVKNAAQMLEEEPEEPDQEPEEVEEVPRYKTNNVFDNQDEINDEVEEVLVTRTPDKPYLISIDEYMQDHTSGDDEFDKLTITYYEGDDVLADEQDTSINDIEGTIGEQHLEMFGVQSGNPSIVYVRNERISTDFEIVKQENSYAETVFGVPSNTRNRVLRMRDDD